MIKRFWTSFLDDNQFVGLKLGCAVILMIIGEVII
jgi:hypothetical protein